MFDLSVFDYQTLFSTCRGCQVWVYNSQIICQYTVVFPNLIYLDLNACGWRKNGWICQIVDIIFLLGVWLRAFEEMTNIKGIPGNKGKSLGFYISMFFQ